MAKINTRPIRIDPDLENIIKDVAKKNNMKMREASKELARMCKIKLKGSKSKREIIF